MHLEHWHTSSFIRERVCCLQAGGLSALADMLAHPNTYLVGQAMEAILK